MFIDCDRVVVRDFSVRDEADLQEILGDGKTMEYCEMPYDREKTGRFLREFCIGRHGAAAAALKETGKVVGYILLNEGEPKVYEMGWLFNRSYWRRGYAYEACSALIRYAFVQLGARRIWAETIDGDRSVKLMEKLGMRPEGVRRRQVRDLQGRWSDLYLYGLSREELPGAYCMTNEVISPWS